MSSVRRIIEEYEKNDLVVRRYEIETPSWMSAKKNDRNRGFAPFPRLFVLELRMTSGVAAVFEGAKYYLAEKIVGFGLDDGAPSYFYENFNPHAIGLYREGVWCRPLDEASKRGGEQIVLGIVLEKECKFDGFGGEEWPLTPQLMRQLLFCN